MNDYDIHESDPVEFTDSLYNSETKYYKLNVYDSGYYYIYGIAPGGNAIQGKLLDSNGNDVSSDWDYGEFSMNSWLDSGYDYYLAINPYNGGDMADYTINIDQNGPQS